jgi:hypothetical protein
MAALWRLVDDERCRADGAAALAARYETRAVPAHLHTFRAQMAALQRRIEERHRSSARLHELHAIRLEKWLDTPGTLRPAFMAAVATTLGLRGAAAAISGGRQTYAVVAASDAAARAAHELEVVLGEGPAAAAVAEGTPIRVGGSALAERWPRYGPAVAELGIQAVIAAPLLLPHRQPAVCLGALCAYDGRPVIADGTALATGRIADALTHTVLRTIQADGFPSVFEEADYQAVVHQAAGVISVHCDCGITDAEALLRAHAFAEDRPVADVAQDVVQGKLRLA